MGFTKDVLRTIITLSIVIFVLLGLSFLGMDRDSESFVVAVITLVMNGIIFVTAVTMVLVDWEPWG